MQGPTYEYSVLLKSTHIHPPVDFWSCKMLSTNMWIQQLEKEYYQFDIFTTIICGQECLILYFDKSSTSDRWLLL